MWSHWLPLEQFCICRERCYRNNWKKSLGKELGKSGAVLPRLMSDFYDSRYYLYVGSWYTSKRLLKNLAENGTVACATAMGNCIKAKLSLKADLLRKEEYAIWRDGNISMVWYNNKKELHFFWGIHGIKVERLLKGGCDRLAPSKLSLVNDYTKYVGGVDRKDALTIDFLFLKHFSINLLMWWHFETSSSRLFNKLAELAGAIINFSHKHKWHFLVPQMYGCAFIGINFMIPSWYSLFSWCCL